MCSEVGDVRLCSGPCQAAAVFLQLTVQPGNAPDFA